jgi:DNA modification methylase
MTIKLYHDDCVDILQTFEANSIDSIVTDPPYGLEFMGKKWDAPWKDGWQAGGGFSKPGIGERKTAWPSFSATSKFGAANPTCGGCGGRARGAKRCSCEIPIWKPIGARKNPENEGLPDDMTGGGMANQMRGYQAWCDHWCAEAFRVLKPGAYMLVFGGTRTAHRVACAIEDAGFEIRDTLMWVYGSGFPKSLDVSKALDKAAGVERTEIVGPKIGHEDFIERTDTHSAGGRSEGWERPWRDDPNAVLRSHMQFKPVTKEATIWAGWGTSLKPSYEPIILARKPLMGTVAQNILKHGVGGLNIDACRVSIADDTMGRFPANLILDGSDEVLDVFAAYGDKGGGGKPRMTKPNQGRADESQYRIKPTEGTVRDHGDTGTAARFFQTCAWTHEEAASRLIYSSKASTKDRAGSKHPTIKPVSLLRYLCKLITPPDGTILDLFAGSGTTGQGAVEEGFKNIILIERETEYCTDIRNRLALFME